MPMQRLAQLARTLFSPKRLRRAAELERLRRAPRYRPTHTRLLGTTIHTPDGPSLCSAYEAIFERQAYAFSPYPHPYENAQAPFIIDGGANIGLSIIYFKQRFPDATVIAFEPDPQIMGYCRRNLAAMGIQNVDLREAALWSSAGERRFAPEGADGGRLADESEESGHAVPTERLRDVIEASPRDVDLLKLDIEGAETEALRDCKDVFGRVHRVFVEHHSFPDRPQTMAELFGILDGAGFRLHVTPENHALQPFVERPLVAGMDLQCNVYAFRE